MPLKSGNYGGTSVEDAQKVEQILPISPPVMGSACILFPDLSEYLSKNAFKIMKRISRFMDSLKFGVCLLLVDRGLSLRSENEVNISQ